MVCSQDRSITLAVILCVIISLPTSISIVRAQIFLNTVTLDNQSGEPALVQVIGTSKHTVEVPDGEKRTVNVAAGGYYLLTRYGRNHQEYRYTKGESFDVEQTATQYSKITITLHKVVGGDYHTRPTSKEEFEAAQEATSYQSKHSGSDINDISQSRYFDPAKGRGLVLFEYGKDGYPFKIKHTQYIGYLVLHFFDKNTRAGLLPKLDVRKFLGVKEGKRLFSIGTINLEHIKEIQILEENRNYSEKYPNAQYPTMSPYFKARIILQDENIYIALISAFDFIEAQDESLKFSGGVMVIEKNLTIHKINKGMTVVRIANQ